MKGDTSGTSGVSLYGCGRARKAGITMGFTAKSRSAKKRGKLARNEMSEGWEHLLQAAILAATGAATSVGTARGKVSNAASRGLQSTMAPFAPLTEAYRHGAADAAKAQARQERMRSSRKWAGIMIGVFAVGAVAAAAGTMIMRKRRHSAEYDPNHALREAKFDSRSTMDKEAGRVRSELEEATGRSKSPVDKASEKTKAALDKATDKTSVALDKATSKASKAMDKTADKLHAAATTLNGRHIRS